MRSPAFALLIVLSAILGLVSLLMPTSVLAQACLFNAERNGKVDVANIDRVVITAGAGSLRVTGKAGARQIEADGTACASSREILERININVRTEGRVAYVETVLPEQTSSLFGGGHAYLNLTVTLPDNLSVEARDSSGDAELRHLKQLNMTDSSGALLIADIAGLARVQDSSGDIRIDRVGSVNLEDSSGDVRVRDVKADVEIPSDSSGSLEIDQVGGAVRIQQDSSGDIYVKRVRGNVRIESDSSGGITVRDIGGDFTVDSDSSGGINHEKVQGRVAIPRES